MAFDLSFVDDEALRQILVRDFEEASRCLEFGLPKATMVMAGAVTEGLLQYALLISMDDPTATQKMSLGELIVRCKGTGVIDCVTAKACEILQSYRNLAHPGREVRSREPVALRQAQASLELVLLVAESVGTYCTRQQPAARLAERFRDDPEYLVFVEYLLSRASESNRLRTLRELQRGVLEGRSWTTDRNGKPWGRERSCENLCGLLEMIYTSLSGDSRVTIQNGAEAMFDRYGVDYFLFAHPLCDATLLPDSLKSSLVTYLSRKAGGLPIDDKSARAAQGLDDEAFSLDYRRARSLQLINSFLGQGDLPEGMLDEVYAGVASMWISLDEQRQEPLLAVKELLASLGRIGKMNDFCDFVRFLSDRTPAWVDELDFLLELAAEVDTE